MIEELQTAGENLSVALERYLAACSAITNYYDPADTLNGISRAISGALPRQLELITTWETKFKLVELTIKRTRNVIPSIAPVNTLPPDVLTYVFQLVRGGHEEPVYYYNEQNPFLVRYPETFTQVCWRWRQIAISSRTLWSRIDLGSFKPDMSRRLLARAELLVTRANPSPLYIHITSVLHDEAHETDTALNAFCASIATQMRSLSLACVNVRQHELSIIQSCLSNSTPGTLEVILAADYDKILDPLTFTGSGGQSPDVTGRCLEDALLPVRVLRLTGTFFHWTSQAYHGLVELHLIAVSTYSPIPQLEFIEILRRSPKLRVLHLDLRLEIEDPPQHSTSHAVVRLADLEVLNLRIGWWKDTKLVLRLLSPGSKPLQLSLAIPPTTDSLSSDELTSFVSRSNIKELYLESEDEKGAQLSFPELCSLLHIPGLRNLSLGDFKFNPEPNVNSASQSPNYQAISHLETLRLGKCSVHLDDIRRVAEVVRIQKLELVGCLGYEPQEFVTNGVITPIVVTRGPLSFSIRQWDPWE